MKKAISLLGAIIILLSIPVVSVAAQNEYKLPDVGITIVIPDGNYVLTRDISSSDPALTFFGMSKTDCLSFMEERNIYLNAVNSDVTKEIVVTMTENIISDLNLLPNSSIDTMLSSLIDTYSQAGITIDSSDYYQHEQAKFIVFGIHQNGTDGLIYGKQYFTIYNYKAINVTFYSYDGPLSDWDNIINLSTISGIKFSTPPQKQAPAAKTEPIKYTDPKTGVSFTVPANWIQEETNKPRETIDVKFESTDYEAMILFGCVDLWSQLTESERAGYKKSDVNLSVLSNEEIKGIVSSFGGNGGTYRKETISGAEYIVFDQIGSLGAFSATIKVYFTLKNGYAFLFQYSGGTSEAHKDDFIAALQSADYSKLNSSQTNSTGQAIGIIIAIIILIGIAGLIIFLIKKKKTDQEIQAPFGANLNNQAVINAVVQPELEIREEPIVDQPEEFYCPYCGKKLPKDSVFCQFCGNRV